MRFLASQAQVEEVRKQTNVTHIWSVHLLKLNFRSVILGKPNHVRELQAANQIQLTQIVVDERLRT